MGARRQRRGANAVEFGLVMPIFVALVGGICDLAWQATQQAALESSAHFGCRQGSLLDPGPNEAELPAVRAATSAAMVTWLEEHGATCGVDGCTTEVLAVGANPARSLQCSITSHFTPLLGLVVSERDLTADTIVRLEYQRSP
jgi:hypothetical protein